MAVSRAPLAKLQAYKRRMGWTFPWASSYGSDFNGDFSVSFTEEQQREGVEYNYRRGEAAGDGPGRQRQGPVAQFAAMTGTDAATYTRERPGLSAFVLEDGVVYHTYSTYSRGLDGIWGMYQWLDRAPLGRNETGAWWRRHDEYRAERSSCESRASRRVGAALRSQRGGDDRLVRVDVGHGRDADARRLDDVDGVDADAGPDMARCRGLVPRHVGRDDGGDDAAGRAPGAAALSRGRRPTTGTPDRLTALVGAGYFAVWTAFGVAAYPLGAALAGLAMRQPGAVSSRADGDRRGRAVRRRTAIHRLEGPASGLLPGRARARRRTAARRSGAWRLGLRLGLQCFACCGNLMLILLLARRHGPAPRWPPVTAAITPSASHQPVSAGAGHRARGRRGRNAADRARRRLADGAPDAGGTMAHAVSRGRARGPSRLRCDAASGPPGVPGMTPADSSPRTGCSGSAPGPHVQLVEGIGAVAIRDRS